MTKLKHHILFYSDANYFGGSENMIANFCNSIKLHNHYDVSFSFRYSKEYFNGIKVRIFESTSMYPIKLPILTATTTKILPINLFQKFSTYFWFIAQYMPVGFVNFFILYKKFRQISPDILHINNGGYPGSFSCRIAVVAAKIARIKIIVFVVNNQTVDYRNHYRWPDYFLDKLVTKYVSMFVTGSLEAGEKLKSVLKINSNQQQIIPNGIGFREITESKESTMQRLGILNKYRIVFGVVGVMEKRKGHQYLLESLNIIKKLKKVSEDEFIVLIEGTGGLLRELMEFSDRKDLNRYVKFIGVENNIFNFMSAIDVLIFPALKDEDLPNVVSEAMLLGKAVISSKVSGTNIQVINGKTGFLVEAGSKEQLVKAIMNIVREPNLIHKFGVKGRERFYENFTAEQAVRKYMKLYSTLNLGITKH